MAFTISAMKRVVPAIALVLVACTGIVDPPLDARAVRFDAPSVYSRWWTMTETCSGISGDLGDVTWYEIPGVDVVSDNGKPAAAYWAPVGKNIVVAGNLRLNGSLIRHEMLHALRRDKDGHSRRSFLEQCGGIVSCSATCIGEAGPPPLIDPSILRVESDSLALTVNIEPEFPMAAADDGIFEIVVSATNKKTYRVVVPPSSLWLNRAFFYTIFGPAGGIASNLRVTDSAETLFAPGETKRHVFDIAISDAFGLDQIVPGTFTIYGGYSATWATIENVVIKPLIVRPET